MPVLRDQTGGSAVPCAVPLGWRIARVDESFGLRSHDEARAALEKAATLWNRAVGRGLFSNETDGDLPVRFVYDERQARTQERSRLVQDFNEASAGTRWCTSHRQSPTYWRQPKRPLSSLTRLRFYDGVPLVRVYPTIVWHHDDSR